MILIPNQSLKWNPQGNRKVSRQNPPGRENFKMNLKRSTKLSVKPQQLLLQKKMETPCAWPTLYLGVKWQW